jgi:hypothetical protein
VVPPIAALIAVIVTNIGDPKGFVFTPWWSAAFAVWILFVVTLVLHWLVLTQLEPQTLVSMGGCITSALTGQSAVEVVGAVLATISGRAGRGLATLATR